MYRTDDSPWCGRPSILSSHLRQGSDPDLKFKHGIRVPWETCQFFGGGCEAWRGIANPCKEACPTLRIFRKIRLLATTGGRVCRLTKLRSEFFLLAKNLVFHPAPRQDI